MRSIQHFLLGNKIPSTLPLPPTTLPYAITSGVTTARLQALGWAPLELVPWLYYLLTARSRLGDDRNLTTSPAFATQVLLVLSRNWDNLSSANKATVVQYLQEHTTIPTRRGMRRPTEAFFPSVKLFDDLPILAQSCHNLKDKFLVALGVRKTLDLDTIFQRLLRGGGAASSDDDKTKSQKQWSHVELVKYLASVQADIPYNDMAKLRETRFCPAEAGPAGLEWTVPSTQLYRASELFAPGDSVRELGFRLMQWPGPPGSFSRSNDVGQFLIGLGLRQTPMVKELVEKMATPDNRVLRDKARLYFIANHQLNGYGLYPVNTTDKRILPVATRPGDNNDKEERLVTPKDCFLNPAAAILGFDILRSDLAPHATKFNVSRDPPTADCVDRLIARPPRATREAIALFEYFSSFHLAGLRGDSLRKLEKAKIVPVSREDATKMDYVAPRECYLGSSATYGAIFDFVDFGATANAFLFKCGSRSEPTKAEVARLACTEPARLLSTLQTPERYLQLLRSLAEDLPLLKNDRQLYHLMKTAPFLLASKEVGGGGGGGKKESKERKGSKGKGIESDDSEEDDSDEDQPIRQYQLAPAKNIAVLDDYISYRLFKDRLMCAPEEDALETFYLALGAQMLSSLVQEDLRVGPRSLDRAKAAKTEADLRTYVLERSKIFLYEYQKYRHKAIRHEHRWLERHLQVVVVQSLALRRSLRSSSSSGDKTHTEKRSAAAAPSTSNEPALLYVSLHARVDMYQVGQAICQLVLYRPSQQAYFFFEPFLKLDLLDLRARGYNVDRILRAKQAEARLAEEERRKALAAEKERIREAEEEWARQGRDEGATGGPNERERDQNERQRDQKTPEPRMPGAFEQSPEYPDEKKQQQQIVPVEQTLADQGRRGRGLFSNLTRRLGLDQGQGELQRFLGGEQSQQQQQQQQQQVTQHQQQQQPQQPSQDGRVTSPAAVQQNMLNAIEATRPFGSSSVFSPPQTTEVKEQATYCDRTQAHHLRLVAQAPNGMSVFLDASDADSTTSDTAFLAAHGVPLAAFAVLLRDIASSVYGLPPGALHIYYDAVGPTMAFNTNGSLFCNLRYFLQLHAPAMGVAATSSAGAARTAAAVRARVDAAIWWWVVLAHELAHNLESRHNAEHSYYTESFIQQYFPKMAAVAASWIAAGPQSTPSSSSSSSSANPPSGDAAPPSYQQAMHGGGGMSSLLE